MRLSRIPEGPAEFIIQNDTPDVRLSIRCQPPLPSAIEREILTGIRPAGFAATARQRAQAAVEQLVGHPVGVSGGPARCGQRRATTGMISPSRGSAPRRCDERPAAKASEGTARQRDVEVVGPLEALGSRLAAPISIDDAIAHAPGAGRAVPAVSPPPAAVIRTGHWWQRLAHRSRRQPDRHAARHCAGCASSSCTALPIPWRVVVTDRRTASSPGQPRRCRPARPALAVGQQQLPSRPAGSCAAATGDGRNGGNSH